MADQSNASRVKILKIWEILNRESDENHPISSNRIIEILEESGISISRKTLYRDIEMLNEFGYEVMCNRSRNNEYYVADRKFDMPELHILLDAVQSASFITKSKTAELVDKIAALAGSYSGDVMKKNIVAFNTRKNVNEYIYYSVNEIVTAINCKKKISFLYFDYDCKHNKVYRKEGREYVANPYATILSDGQYYMLDYNEKHEQTIHYRIDRMEKVKIVDEPAAMPPESRRIDIARYKQQLFGMFSGETHHVHFEADKSLIDVIFDTFGEKVKIKPVDDTHVAFIGEVQLSPIFFGWCCSFGEKLRISGPSDVVEEFRRYINSIVIS